MPARAARDLARRYLEYHAHAQLKIRAAAVTGAIAFPLLYLVWTSVWREHFESLTLSALGAALCLALVASKWWRPATARRYVVPFCYATLLYCLPFFFTFMLLMNEASWPWRMATLAALIYVVLLFDVANAIVVLLVGSAAAVGVYLLYTGGAAVPPGYWAMLPIVVLALVGCVGLTYSDSLIAHEKLKAAASLASQVAHECRTPLTGIRFEIDGCERLLARLPVSPLRDRLAASNRRARQHINSANAVIDLLLANVAQQHQRVPASELHSMRRIVEQALERYSFRPNQRELVHTDLAEDFAFRGSDLLMIHVLFNLLKNGLRAIEAKGSADNHMLISLRRGDGVNAIVVADTGEGIPSELLDYIFVPFVSGQRAGVGTGLGLSFCRMIVEGVGGSIWCQSERQVGTCFTIELPAVEPATEDAAAA